MRSTAMKRGRISNKNYTGPKMDREPSEIDRKRTNIIREALMSDPIISVYK